jgi:hypothetical protein
MQMGATFKIGQWESGCRPNQQPPVEKVKQFNPAQGQRPLDPTLLYRTLSDGEWPAKLAFSHRNFVH